MRFVTSTHPFSVSSFHLTILGGLNSYGLIILIVAFLNQDWTEIYKRDGAVSSGKALKSFLYYFGKLFDPNVSMVNELQQVVPHMNFASILII